MPRWESAKERVDARWIPEPNTGCWLWTGALNTKGYGELRNGTITSRHAHRYSWTIRNGEIPEGLVIDHNCRVRSCVNPDHMRLVTTAQNVTENSLGQSALNKLKTHCPNGHAYTTANTVRYGRARHCRTCYAERRPK